jgi:serine/threonine protein kinase
VLPSETLLRGGDYQIDYALGRGGFGITYRAAHIRLEKLVAIKEFYPQEQVHREGATGRLTVPKTAQAAYERGLQRFEKEGRILAKLNHANVVKVIDFFKERGTAYLVMELLAGGTLRDELDSQPGKRLSVERVKEIMIAFVDALTAVHQQGIYHLDLKPDNAIVTPEGRIVLVDFGASRQDFGTRSGTRTSTHAFTEAYAPPEVMAGKEVGAASDLFELAMMLHEMLTGKLPPTALNRLMTDDWLPHELDEPWRGMVTGALQIQPQYRPKSLQDWWGTVLRFEEEQRRRDEERKRQEAEREAEAKAKAEEEQRRQEERKRQEAKREAEAKAKAQEEQRQRDEAKHQQNRSQNFRAREYLNQGLDKYIHRDFSGAIEDYNEAIFLNPYYDYAYKHRGNAKYNAGDKQGAIEDYRKAAELFLGRGKQDNHREVVKLIKELQEEIVPAELHERQKEKESQGTCLAFIVIGCIAITANFSSLLDGIKNLTSNSGEPNYTWEPSPSLSPSVQLSFTPKPSTEFAGIQTGWLISNNSKVDLYKTNSASLSTDAIAPSGSVFLVTSVPDEQGKLNLRVCTVPSASRKPTAIYSAAILVGVSRVTSTTTPIIPEPTPPASAKPGEEFFIYSSQLKDFDPPISKEKRSQCPTSEAASEKYKSGEANQLTSHTSFTPKPSPSLSPSVRPSNIVKSSFTPKPSPSLAVPRRTTVPRYTRKPYSKPKPSPSLIRPVQPFSRPKPDINTTRDAAIEAYKKAEEANNSEHQ